MLRFRLKFGIQLFGSGYAGLGIIKMFLHIILLASVISLCFYIWVVAKVWKLRNLPILTDPQDRISSKDKVTVVIAARNEAESVSKCLTSILTQERVKEIIFVDDHSTDKTLELAKKVADDSGRVRILSAPYVPDGWTGKTHALNYGARDITTEYILFTDADVLISPGTIDAAINYMDKERLDHLSGNFYIHCISASESICAPVLAASSAIALFNAAKNQGAATGAFNMIRTDFYHRIDGHKQIKDAIVDDVCLARLAKSSGGRSAFVNLADRAIVRLFCGIGGFLGLITRSSQSYLGEKRTLPLIGGLAIGAIGFFTLLVPFLILALYLRGETSYNYILTLCVLAGVDYFLGFASCLSVRRFHDGKVLYVFIYPLPLSLLGFSACYSSIRKLMGLKISWRGRKYKAA